MSNNKVVIHAYGDESVNKYAVTYGLFVIQDDKVKKAEKSLKELKSMYGVPENEQVHCRVLFNGHPRKKSGWAHLSLAMVFMFLNDLVEDQQELGGEFRVGYIDRSDAPSKLLTDGPFKETPLDEKQLVAFAFQSVTGMLDEKYGFDNVKLWTDPDKTKIPWFGKNKRADKNFQMYSDISGGPEPKFIESQLIEGEKPCLLEIADVIASIASKAESSRWARVDRRYIDLYKKMKAQISSINFNPGPSTKV